ncbi:dihydrofolate reductase family protein [Nocardioides sp.]|uniref:dihydrofolate reductase family protein n=1 Tax=Nocardioides sp. TaxID=35761 RepID=UPI00262514BB|nr:dihydrofolate reductase family protein [Nocardioides sp.]
MTRFIFTTATTLDGYLADPQDSLDWLFAVEGGEESLVEMAGFVHGVGVLVEGSTTYRWVVEHEDLAAQPDRWQAFYGDRRTFVFTSRPDEQPRIPGADVAFVSGPVADHLDAIVEAADGKNVWIMGGGDLAAQFAAAGRLDELRLSIAPVLLGSGAPLFTGRLESDRLRLVETHQTGQFLSAVYTVA